MPARSGARCTRHSEATVRGWDGRCSNPGESSGPDSDIRGLIQRTPGKLAQPPAIREQCLESSRDLSAEDEKSAESGDNQRQRCRQNQLCAEATSRMHFLVIERPPRANKARGCDDNQYQSDNDESKSIVRPKGPDSLSSCNRCPAWV